MKKERFKRMLSVLISASLIVTMVPVTGTNIYAEEMDELQQIEQEIVPNEIVESSDETSEESLEESLVGTDGESITVYNNSNGTNEIEWNYKLGTCVLDGDEAIFVDADTNEKMIDIPTYVLVSAYDGVESSGMKFTQETVTDPNAGKVYKVTTISENCFYNKRQTQIINIPNTITSNLTHEFFETCDSLTTINVVRSNVNEPYGRYYDGADFNDSKGVLIDLKDTGKQKVVYCPVKTPLTTYNFPNYYASRSFEVADGAFKGCENLTSITNNSLYPITRIGKNAFENCTGLSSAMVLNRGIQRVEDEAFKGCVSLKSIRFAEDYPSPIYLGNRVFENTAIESIHFPYMLTDVRGTTFYGMNSLKTITVDKLNDYFYAEKGALYNYDSVNKKRGNRLVVVPAALGLTDGTYQIPNGVTELDPDSIMNCENLSTIKFPSNIYSISNNAIHSCTALRKVYIYSGFPDLQLDQVSFDDIFADCGYGTRSITIYAGLNTRAWQFATEKGYEKSALYDQSKYSFADTPEGQVLTGITYDQQYQNIVIPDFIVTNSTTRPTTKSFVVKVSENALANPNITSVMFMAHMNNVDPNAFRIVPDPDDFSKDTNADSLQSIYIEEGNTALCSIDGVLYKHTLSSNGVDYNISELLYYPVGRIATTYDTPSTLSYLPPNAFRGASKLKILNISDSIQGIGGNATTALGDYNETAAFAGCKNLVAINIVKSNSGKQIKYGSHQGVLYQADNGALVTLLFYPKGQRIPIEVGLSAISYEIPSGCLKIEDVKNCIYLKSITIPKSVETIDSHAFEGCFELGSVIFKETGTGNGIKTIGERAFANTKLLSITIPATVKNIGKQAFYNCIKLGEVVIKGDNLLSIGEEAFYRDTALTKVTIYGTQLAKGGEVVVAKSAFRYCTKLTNFAITNMKSASLNEYSLANNTSLKSVNFNQTDVNVIANSVFQNCSALEKIDLSDSDGLKRLGTRSFKDCSSLSKVVLPSNLETIGEQVFENCSKLGDLNFQDLKYLRAIEFKAFKNCAFTTITIKNGLLELGNMVFMNNTMLTSIYLPVSLPKSGITGNPFEGFNRSLKVYGEKKSGIQQFLDDLILSNKPTFIEGEIPSININVAPSVVYIYDIAKKQVQLTATTQPENADIIWKSTDTNVATVDINTGLVSAVQSGTVDVYAIATESGAKAACKVVVEKARIELSEEIQNDSVILNTKGTSHYVYTNAVSVPLRTVYYKTENNRVATINRNGKITGVREGTTIVTVYAGTKADGTYIEKDINVTVRKPAIALNKTRITLNEKGDQGMLTAEVLVTHTGAENKVTWVSANPRIATVDGDNDMAKITAVRAGKVNITAICNGIKKTCVVTVKPVYTRLNASTKTLYVGGNKIETLKLKAKTSGINKTITWESKNPEFATVDSKGLVTAISYGTTVITATANGITAECVVKVLDSTITITNHAGAELKPCVLLLNSKGNNKYQLGAKVVGRSSKVKWMSTAKEICTVNSKGIVTGKLGGSADIIAIANGVETSCNVTIVDTFTKLDSDKLLLYVNGTGTEKTKTITATIEGADTMKNVTWKSSNEAVVSISGADGRATSNPTVYGGQATAKITAGKAGKATITATANGVTAKCVVTVK